MTVKFTMDSKILPEGTILLFGLRYVGAYSNGDVRTPGEESKVYTYAMLKAGGFWYATGGGRTPQIAGWGAVERWLEKDGRVVEWVRVVTETAQIWPVEEAEPCQPIGCDNGYHLPGCMFTEIYAEESGPPKVDTPTASRRPGAGRDLDEIKNFLRM